ncbi:MAG TPA: hypothetical protein VMU42_08060 [Candidatus Sulfotelmatobacter sp.]|nr:hypothetical protein [Candidatus Sulfotelmatobacter sp.]
MTRTALSGPTTIYYSPTAGSNSSGDGSLSAPFLDPGGAWEYLASEVDLNGQQVTILWTGPSGTITSDLSISGKLVGQTYSSQVIVQGNPNDNSFAAASPSNCNPALTKGNYVWAPSPQPQGHLNCITMSEGCARVVGFDFEMMNAMSGGSNPWGADDAINISGAELWLSDCVFGETLSMHNGLSAEFRSKVFIDGPIEFATSAMQAGFGIGQGSLLFNTAGGSNGKNYCISSGTPSLGYGWLFGDEMGDINWAGVPIMQAETANWQLAAVTVGANEIVVPDPSWVAEGFFVFSPLFPPMTTVTGITGSTLTLSNPALASSSGANLLIGALGTASCPGSLTAWLGSVINAGGTGAAQFPGATPTVGSSPCPGSIWASTLQ